jgi:hypothetical protein
MKTNKTKKHKTTNLNVEQHDHHEKPGVDDAVCTWTQ